jgi:hypothetical protein
VFSGGISRNATMLNAEVHIGIDLCMPADSVVPPLLTVFAVFVLLEWLAVKHTDCTVSHDRV